MLLQKKALTFAERGEGESIPPNQKIHNRRSLIGLNRGSGLLGAEMINPATPERQVGWIEG